MFANIMARDGWMVRSSHRDRITELPYYIRLEILRLLPRKYAIRTGALSTQWQDSWKERFPYPTELKFGKPYVNEEEQQELVSEIDHDMMLHNNMKIETFHLFFCPGSNYQDITRGWIKQAVANNTEEIYLDFSQGLVGFRPFGGLVGKQKKIVLKENIFKDNSLTIMSLSYCRLHQNFKFRHFDFLESISLLGVNINDYMLEKLVENCRLLETMYVKECMWLRRIVIVPDHELRLKSLVIVNCWKLEEVEIAGPHLETFHYICKFPSVYLFGLLPRLVDVILVSRENQYWPRLDNRSGMDSMFMELDSAKVLTICSRGIEYVLESTTCVTFELNHLQELQLLMEKMAHKNLIEIYIFFAKCRLPCLEKLFIEFPTAMDNPFMGPFLFPAEGQEPPNFYFMSLKMVKMNNFKGDLNEMLLLEFVLEKAISLELVILVVPCEHDLQSCINDKVSLYQSVSTLRRMSPNVVIKLLCDWHDDKSLGPSHSKKILELE